MLTPSVRSHRPGVEVSRQMPSHILMILGRQSNCWMRVAGPLDGIYASPHQLPLQALPTWWPTRSKQHWVWTSRSCLFPRRRCWLAHALAEKKLSLPWDLLIIGWFDLSSEAPPATVHREFFGSDGAFRAGPELPDFNRLYTEMAAQIDGQKLVKVAEQIDRYVFDEALALFLCAPQALYAVNKHVNFGPYRTTFELAETEVDEQHWSRRRAQGDSQAAQAAQAPDKKGSTSFTSGSSGNAC